MTAKQNIRETWWFALGSGVLLVILGIVLQRYILPPPQEKPQIEPIYQFIRTVPFNPDLKERLRFDYETDRDISGVQFFVTNDGRKEANNLEIDIMLRNKKIRIEESTIVFDPCRLENRILAFSDDSSSFYRKLRTFPCDGRIYIMISTSSPISEEDIDFDFLSEGQIWQPKYGEIDLKKVSKWSVKKNIPSSAFAQPSDEQEPQAEGKVSSGISVGGYDPLALANNTFLLLQKKNLISADEAKEAKEEIESYKKGVLFGGINPLKFNEVILNALVRNKRISTLEAEECIAKSKESGGVLISGHNVIVLNVEILNKLLQNDWIGRDEAQEAIDDAKLVTWKNTPGAEWMNRPGTEWMNR